jgi:hypothetical protein
VRGVPDAVGIHAYGASWDEAVARAQALALRVIADRLEAGLLALAAAWSFEVVGWVGRRPAPIAP